MTDETTVCEHCFGTGQKVEMRPVRLGAKLPPYEPCPHCNGPKPPPHKPARFISTIAAARRKRKP
jgi:DnaJ-class molecular chaperone